MSKNRINPNIANIANIASTVLLVTALVAVLFMSWAAHAQQDNVAVKFQIKYLGYDNFNTGFKMHVNISTNAPGHLTYLEEYYTVDGSSNPRFVASKGFDGGDLVKVNKSYNASFDILRPTGFYTLVKAVVLIDNNRVFEYWLTKNRDFIDNTGTPDDGGEEMLAGVRNIERYEAVEDGIATNTNVAFNYKTLGDISKIDVMGSGNDDLSLKVEILKGRDSMTVNPGVPVYRYVNIKSDSVYIQNISIYYRVENDWMKNGSIPAKNVKMLGWDSTDKIWRVLPTVQLDSDSRYTYYMSVSGFNTLPYFAIAGQKAKKIATTAQKSNGTNKTVTAKKNNDTVAAKPLVGTLPILPTLPAVKSLPGFGYVMALIALIALIALVVIYRKRRKLS